MTEQDDPNHWRQLFGDRQRGAPREQATPSGERPRSQGSAFGYDDGYDPRTTAAHPSAPPSPGDNAGEAAAALALDTRDYRPWIVQRGRSRPTLMLELRRYEPRSSLWSSWAMAYPSLYALDQTGDRLLSLDFGNRHFVIEGHGLDQLAQHIQQGSALAVIEHSAALWATRPDGPCVTAIRRIEGSH